MAKRFSAPFEGAARLGEFRKGLISGATAFESSIAGKVISIDFNIHGAAAAMQALNAATMFLNPAIQSLSTDIRAVRTNWNRILFWGGVLGVAHMGLWFAYRDDQEINDRRKTPYGSLWTWFRYPDGTIGKLPKPFVWGQIFGTGFETALDALEGEDPDAVNRLGEALWEAVKFNAVPTAAYIGIGYVANKDLWSGIPIEDEELQGLSPQYRFREKTSVLAKNIGKSGIGKTVGLSPMVVDYFIGSVFGSMGRDLNNAIDIVDRARRDAPTPAWQEFPFIRRLFGSTSNLNVQPIVEFYQDAMDYETVANDLNHLAFESQRGPEQMQEYIKFIEDNVVEIGLHGLYSKYRQGMTDRRNSIEQWNITPGIDKKERQRQVKLERDNIIEDARRANALAKEIKKGYVEGAAVADARRGIELGQGVGFPAATQTDQQ
jgi:hypothetical protein